MPRAGTEAAGERPRQPLGSLRASPLQPAAPSRTPSDSSRSETSEPKPTIGHFLLAAREESRAREEFNLRQSILGRTDSGVSLGSTGSSSRSESMEFRPEAPRGRPPQLSLSPSVAEQRGTAPLLSETKNTRLQPQEQPQVPPQLQAQLTLKHMVVETGETSAPKGKDKGKAPASDISLQPRTGAGSGGHTLEILTESNVAAGIGERRPLQLHSGRSQASHPSHRQPHLTSGESSGSSHVSTAGIGEKRPRSRPSSRPTTREPSPEPSRELSRTQSPPQSFRFDPTRIDPATGSVIHSPRESRQHAPHAPPSQAFETPSNWRTQIADLARMAGQQLAQTADVATMVQPNGRLLAAAAGHLAHQAVSVGIPTFAREMLAAGLSAGLHAAAPQVAIGLQAGMMALGVTLQVVRERRESRDPDEAARGFHSLSAEQWAQSSPQQQDTMRQTQARHSRMFTALQVAASSLNLGLTVSNVRNGEATTAIARVATDVKTAVYTTMRDALQASFRMVGIQGETNGLGGAHLTTAVAAYAAVQLTAGYAGQALATLAAPGSATASNVLNGVLTPQEAGLSLGAAWGTAATVAGVRAALNTVVEAVDWFQRTQLEATQGGTRQELAPRINTAPENRDYGRLLDHMPARMALINTINSVVGAASYFARNAPDAVESLIGNVGSAGVNAMLDYSVTNTWQAAAAVRASTSASPPVPEAFGSVQFRDPASPPSPTPPAPPPPPGSIV